MTWKKGINNTLNMFEITSKSCSEQGHIELESTGCISFWSLNSIFEFIIIINILLNKKNNHWQISLDSLDPGNMHNPTCIHKPSKTGRAVKSGVKKTSIQHWVLLHRTSMLTDRQFLSEYKTCSNHWIIHQWTLLYFYQNLQWSVTPKG